MFFTGSFLSLTLQYPSDLEVAHYFLSSLKHDFWFPLDISRFSYFFLRPETRTWNGPQEKLYANVSNQFALKYTFRAILVEMQVLA